MKLRLLIIGILFLVCSEAIIYLAITVPQNPTHIFTDAQTLHLLALLSSGLFLFGGLMFTQHMCPTTHQTRSWLFDYLEYRLRGKPSHPVCTCWKKVPRGLQREDLANAQMENWLNGDF